MRLNIVGQLPPMSLHVGVIRIGAGRQLVADLLVDASDIPHFNLESARCWTAFGTVLYAQNYREVIEKLAEEFSFGTVLPAFE